MRISLGHDARGKARPYSGQAGQFFNRRLVHIDPLPHPEGTSQPQ